VRRKVKIANAQPRIEFGDYPNVESLLERLETNRLIQFQILPT